MDPARVFAVGVSAGGMMAYRLGCELSGRVTGVGAVAGAMILDDCRPTRPLSVIEIHGTADQLVPYEGGRTAGGGDPAQSSHRRRRRAVARAQPVPGTACDPGATDRYARRRGAVAPRERR